MPSRTSLTLAALAGLTGLAAAVATLPHHAFAQEEMQAGAPRAGRGQGYVGPHTNLDATVNDPAGAPPDPSHIIMVLPNQIKWTGNVALLYGSPTKDGDPYGMVVKIPAGQFSAPHKLSKDRWVYVISGTLWVSDGGDAKKSSPVVKDNFLTNTANTSFSDGNRAGATEPTMLFISGVGSADNHVMDEYSKKTTVSVKDAAGPAPDAAHISITPIPLDGNHNLYGGGQDSTGEGTPYGVIQTWPVGRTSSPHYHTQPRYIYVLNGPWWVSSSTYHDTKLTYPVPTGSFVQDLPHGIHWDGNRVGADYTTRLYITGVSPATNHGVDEDGKDLPPQPRGAGRRGGAE
jgi:quercetin dioxygenase-like cupin family protein